MKFEIFFLTFFSMIEPRTYLLPGACIILLLVSCQNEGRPLPEKLTAAYADLLTFRDASRDMDSTRYAAGIDSVLAHHGFDRASFSNAFGDIGTSVDKVNAFFDSTNSRLTPPRQKE